MFRERACHTPDAAAEVEETTAVHGWSNLGEIRDETCRVLPSSREKLFGRPLLQFARRPSQDRAVGIAFRESIPVSTEAS